MKIILIVLLAFFYGCQSQEVYVANVHDGDTFYYEGGIARLSEIDAPELGQPYGLEAKFYLESLILHKFVKLDVKGKDTYGRTLCEVRINGAYTNELMIRKGLAWAYKPYTSITLYNEYIGARKNKVGLWVDSNPQPPFMYRKTIKP